ncbi:LuxR C-terminal-related transcriptional regulator [Mariluticola halotolerans]|uniref:LuxR C-terminal-related transcriptional regulator n=1 Tax=Mariluticola halotolerans TaxID=2909283 RepID=UPI0026E3D691|nr:LuxR C-terminal-related transcriptional regulator [Mariluticola halotolerans]UJQ93424.1 LuxR C-terminal-related transcriptional regulator [Mariluticola halotolerans]
MRFALEALPVPMVYAAHRIIRAVNAEFADLFGYERAELRHQSFNILYPKLADFVMVGDMWRTNFAGGRSYEDERIMQKRDGTKFWCRVRGRSMLAEDPFSEAIYCFDAMARPVPAARTGLTPRQTQIVTLVAMGKTNKDIARETGLSQRTVETHRLRIIRTLGLANSAELVAWFMQQGGQPRQ